MHCQYESSDRQDEQTRSRSRLDGPNHVSPSETGFDCPALALLDAGAELRYCCTPINRRNFQSHIASVSHENPITCTLRKLRHVSKGRQDIGVPFGNSGWWHHPYHVHACRALRGQGLPGPTCNFFNIIFKHCNKMKAFLQPTSPEGCRNGLPGWNLLHLGSGCRKKRVTPRNEAGDTVLPPLRAVVTCKAGVVCGRVGSEGANSE